MKENAARSRSLQAAFCDVGLNRNFAIPVWRERGFE